MVIAKVYRKIQVMASEAIGAGLKISELWISPAELKELEAELEYEETPKDIILFGRRVVIKKVEGPLNLI